MALTRTGKKQTDGVNGAELVLLALLNIAWVARLIFVGVFAYRFVKGTLLTGAAMGWRIAFLASYIVLGLQASLYVSSFWRDRGAMDTRERRVEAMKVRLLFHTSTIALISMEIAWDFGHTDWVVSILTSLLSAGIWFSASEFLVRSSRIVAVPDSGREGGSKRKSRPAARPHK
jgi:hypothetical protein